MEEQKLARAFGWFSIGLGVAEVAAPRQMGRLTGLDNHENLLRVYGLREILVGIGLLAQRGPGKPAPYLWARVGGDALDLTTLGTAAALAPNDDRRKRAVTALAVTAGITALDVIYAARLSAKQREIEGESADPGLAERSLTIGVAPETAYQLWRSPETLPRLMADFAEVASLNGSGLAHWRVKIPAGRTLEWESEVVEDRPGETIRWQSRNGAAVPSEGSVRFRPAPGNRGTEAILRLQFAPHGGIGGLGRLPKAALGIAAGKALRRFKSLIETGEIPTTRPQPAARADKD